MQTTKLLFALLIFPSTTMATQKCYEFEVKKYSKGLEKIELTMTSQEKPANSYAAEIFAKKSTALSTLTPFKCEESKKKITCTQPEGGGDFTLKTKKEKATMTLTYMNLIIGSKGPTKLPEGGEIDESFAILDIANSKETAKRNELEEFSIQGKEITCTTSAK